MEVLECSARAPQDLRKKALGFAARILRWAPDITSDAAANSRAESLLNSGAAKLAFERIIETQGRRTPRLALGSLAANMVASRSGVVGEINGWKIAGIARRAGAPRDHGAGLDLFVRRGDAVRAGDALYAIRSNRQTELTAAVGEATSDSGIEIS